MSYSVPEIEDAEVIFNMGYNAATSHPLVARRIVRAKKKGAKIICVDPRKTETYEDVVKEFMSERQRAMLRKMINFKFTLHPRYNLSKSRLKVIEKFLQKRANELLDL